MITRHYVTLGKRGSCTTGAPDQPAVFFVHNSPLSRSENIPFLERFAGDFTAIAPDT